MDGPMFAKIIREEFKQAFAASSNSIDKVFLMNGCPRQNAAIARNTWTGIGAELFTIPARSPDLNPIEKLFPSCMQRAKERKSNFIAAIAVE
jgi:transposase